MKSREISSSILKSLKSLKILTNSMKSLEVQCHEVPYNAMKSLNFPEILSSFIKWNEIFEIPRNLIKSSRKIPLNSLNHSKCDKIP